MAAARGIDLVQAAKQSTALPRSNTRTWTRHGVRVTELVEGPGQAAYGRETRSVDEPEFSAADAGFALMGLGRAETLAALYAWAGQSQNYWPLVVELRTVGMRMRRRDHWPEMVERTTGQPWDYLERLCEMVLFEDGHPGMLDYAPPAKIGQPEQKGILRAVFCDVNLPTWSRHLAGPYANLFGLWTGWLDHAARSAQARLRED